MKIFYDKFVVGLVNSKPIPSKIRSYFLEEDCGLIDVTDGIYLIKPTRNVKYNFCFDGVKFVEFGGDLSSLRKLTHSPLVLVSPDTILMNDTKIYRVVQELMGRDIKGGKRVVKKIAQLSLIEGVPGCEKTTYIVERADPSNSLVLTSTKEGAEDLRRRFKQPNNRNIRTVDSYLMNSRSRADVVWIDEALMRYPGDIIMVACFSNASKIYLLGDKAQIPFIYRMSGVILKYDKMSQFVNPTKFLNVSHRIPIDIAARINSSYPQKQVQASNRNKNPESHQN